MYGALSRLLLVIGVLGLTCVPAAAQSSPWQEQERTTAGWVFTPGASLGVIWDSGIETTSNPVVEKLFQSWVGLANPRAELDYNGRRTHLNLGYSGALEKYWGEEMIWEQRGRVGLRQTVTSRFSVTGDASYASVPTTDRLELVDGVVPFIDIDSRWFGAGGGLSFRAGPRTSIQGDYRFAMLTLDRELLVPTLGTLQDGHSHAGSLGFMRDFTSRLGIGATGAYRREFAGSDAADQFDVKDLTAETSYRWDATTTLSFGGGVSQLESRLSGERTTSPTVHAGFSREMRTFRLGVHYSRGFQQLFGFGSLAATDQITGEAVVPLRDRMYFMNIVTSYNKTHPVQDLALGFDFSTLWTNVAVGRRLTERVRAEAFVNVAHQFGGDSDSIGRTRIGIQIVTSKPLRIQ